MVALLRTRRFADCRGPAAGLLPKAESAEKGIGIVSQTTVRWKLFQLFGIAAAKNDIIGLQGGGQTLHDFGNFTAPFLFSTFLETAQPNIVLIGGFLIREMAKFHGLNDSVNNQSRAKAGAKTQEEHFAFLVAAQSLHGSVIYDLYGLSKCFLIVESHPTFCHIIRLQERSI